MTISEEYVLSSPCLPIFLRKYMFLLLLLLPSANVRLFDLPIWEANFRLLEPDWDYGNNQLCGLNSFQVLRLSCMNTATVRLSRAYLVRQFNETLYVTCMIQYKYTVYCFCSFLVRCCLHLTIQELLTKNWAASLTGLFFFSSSHLHVCKKCIKGGWRYTSAGRMFN